MTTHIPLLRWATARSGRRGMALLVALMIMLAISGLGLVAMQTAGMEQSVTGNYRLDRQAEYVAESGLMTAMGSISQSGEGFWTVFSRSTRTGGSPTMTLTNSDFTGMLFQDASDPLNPVLTGDATNLNPQVTVTISDPVDGIRAAGSQNGRYCFKRLTFSVTGTVGDDASTIDIEEEFFRSSTHSIQATGLLGPLECEGN